jgi:RecB family exonuclease
VGRIDDFGRPTFLYLTATREKRAQLLREFEGRDAFSPEVHVFGEWCAAWWQRWGDGRALLSDRALALAAWRLLEAEGHRWPALDEIPDRAEAGRLLARLDQRLDGAGAQARDPQLRSAVEALRASVRRTGRGVRRTEALRAMAERLARGEGLPQPHRTVIIDDLFGLSALEGALLTALCRGLDAAGAEVILATASGRDLGGAEVLALIGVDPPSGRRTHRVFAATAAVRAAAMELVGTGEAELCVAGPDGWTEVEPWTEPEAGAPPDLADAYAEGLAVSASTAAEARALCGPGRLRVMSPPDPLAEHRLVARQVADLLRAGVDPRECVVALAAPSAASGVSAALADHGVPHRMVDGVSLAATPLGRGLRWIAGEALDGFTPEGLCGVADLLGVDLAGTDPRDLRRWCAAARIRSGRPTTWGERLAPWAARTRTAREEAIAAALAALEGIALRLEPLAADRSPADWHPMLHDVLARLGVPERAAALEGGLDAWAAAVNRAERLARDLALVEPGPWAAADLRAAFDQEIARATIGPGADGRAAVPVTTISRLAGLTPAHVFVVGLARGAIQRPTEALAPDEAPAPDPDGEARYVLAGLLREATAPDSPIRALQLSWPATDGQAALPPASVLAELLELPASGARLGELLVELPGPEPGRPASVRDRRRAAALADDLPDDPGDIAIQRSVHRDRSGPPGHRDGVLGGAAPPPPPSVSVTALDTYLKCPARYWYTQALGLAPPDPAAPELEPRRRGIALHRILERFLRDRDLAPLTGADPAEARARLHAVAGEVLDEIEAGGGFDPLFQAYARSRWIAGLIDDRPAGILRSWLDRELAERGPVPEAVEQQFDGLAVGPLRVRGVIDRIDRFPGGARLVTDYKTGAPPTRDQVARGLAFQPIAYAAWVAQATGAPVAATYLSLSRPDAIRRSALAGDPRALDAVAEGGERARALSLDDEARDALLAKAAAAADALVAGRFSPTPHAPELAGCRRCPYRRICRLDPVRHGVGLLPEEGPCG